MYAPAHFHHVGNLIEQREDAAQGLDVRDVQREGHFRDRAPVSGMSNTDVISHGRIGPGVLTDGLH